MKQIGSVSSVNDANDDVDVNVDELYITSDNDGIITHGDRDTMDNDDETSIVPLSQETNQEGVDGEK